MEHHGEFFDFAPVMFNPKPVQQPQPSLLIGGDGKAAQRRATLVGDGWLPMNHSLEQLPGALAEINEQRSAAGREGAPRSPSAAASRRSPTSTATAPPTSTVCSCARSRRHTTRSTASPASATRSSPSSPPDSPNLGQWGRRSVSQWTSSRPRRTSLRWVHVLGPRVGARLGSEVVDLPAHEALRAGDGLRALGPRQHARLRVAHGDHHRVGIDGDVDGVLVHDRLVGITVGARVAEEHVDVHGAVGALVAPHVEATMRRVEYAGSGSNATHTSGSSAYAMSGACGPSSTGGRPSSRLASSVPPVCHPADVGLLSRIWSCSRGRARRVEIDRALVGRDRHRHARHQRGTRHVVEQQVGERAALRRRSAGRAPCGTRRPHVRPRRASTPGTSGVTQQLVHEHALRVLGEGGAVSDSATTVASPSTAVVTSTRPSPRRCSGPCNPSGRTDVIAVVRRTDPDRRAGVAVVGWCGP